MALGMTWFWLRDTATSDACYARLEGLIGGIVSWTPGVRLLGHLVIIIQWGVHEGVGG